MTETAIKPDDFAESFADIAASGQDPVYRAIAAEAIRAMRAGEVLNDFDHIKANFSGEELAAYDEMMARWNREDEAAGRAEDADVWRKLVKDAEIPALFKDSKFENLDPDLQPEEMKTCIRFASAGGEIEGKNSLILFGNAGTGKTTLAVATLYAYMEVHKKRGKFLNCAKLFQQLREGFRDKKRGGEGIIDLCKYDMVVIDDLGRQRSSEWVEEQFYVLLDGLYSENRHVVFTSNMTKEVYAAGLDEALRSRLNQMVQPITIVGEDLRLL